MRPDIETVTNVVYDKLIESGISSDFRALMSLAESIAEAVHLT